MKRLDTTIFAGFFAVESDGLPLAVLGAGVQQKLRCSISGYIGNSIAVYYPKRSKRLATANPMQGVRMEQLTPMLDYMNAHPMTDGPSMEHFERDLKAFAKANPNPPDIPFGGLTGLAAQQRKWASGMADGSYMTPRPPEAAPVLDPWTCPSCGAAGNTGRFCPECGGPRPQRDGEWTCPSCGQAGNSGNFCAGCSAKRPG